jgi:hypothetical protein
MLRSEYRIARAERLRMLMLTASDPASAVRLRGFVEKYRDLAERTKKQVESQPLNPVQAPRIKCVRWRTEERTLSKLGSASRIYEYAPYRSRERCC